jgi:hypothetical protein
MPSLLTWLLVIVQASVVLGLPAQSSVKKPYDVQVSSSPCGTYILCTEWTTPPQGHRGGRGDEIENTLPAFARYIGSKQLFIASILIRC